MSKKKLRRVTLVLVGVLLPVGAFGFGYFFKEDSKNNQVAHTLSVNGDIEGSITKSVTTDATGIVPGDQVSTTIDIKPLSTSDSLLRVKVRPYWMNNEGTEDTDLSNKNLKLLEVDSVKKDLSEFSWYKEGDYYYYIGKVNKENNNINLIKGIEFLALNHENEGYNINKYQSKGIGMEVIMEMVQCNGNAYRTKWNSDKQMTNTLKETLDDYLTQSKTLTTD